MTKKIFTIIFCSLMTVMSSAQVVVTNIGNSSTTTDASSYTLSFTSNSGDTYIVAVISTKATTPDIPTASKTGITFSQIGTTATTGRRITIFIGKATSTSTGTITADFGGATQTSGWIDVIKITGHAASPIVQAVTGSGTASANPSISMSAISNASNAVISVFANNTNPFGGTAEAGYSEMVDNGGLAPARGAYLMKAESTTDNTPTVTAAASDWIGIAIEIRVPGGRRIFLIN